MGSRTRNKPSSSSSSSAAAVWRRRDRISDLNDEILGYVLSFLPTKEAGRAAVLGRRWRRIFGSVDTISFEEKDGERYGDWSTYYFEAEELKSCSNDLLDTVNAALLCRRRCAGFHVPLRRLHFAFDNSSAWNEVAVDQWLSYVLRHSRKELHLDLRFCIRPICQYEYENYGSEGDEGSGSDDEPERGHNTAAYVLPRRLFSCAALRTLCVSYCLLKLPNAIDLPALVKLRLTGVRDSRRSIQRLISSCPRLADLELEDLAKLTTVSVLEVRLRSLAIRCCHSLKAATIDAAELRYLEYSGAVPVESIITLRDASSTVIHTTDLCEARRETAEVLTE